MHARSYKWHHYMLGGFFLRQRLLAEGICYSHFTGTSSICKSIMGQPLTQMKNILYDSASKIRREREEENQ